MRRASLLPLLAALAAAPLAAVLPGCLAFPEEATYACAVDADCRGGQLCVESRCAPAAGAAGGAGGVAGGGGVGGLAGAGGAGGAGGEKVPLCGDRIVDAGEACDDGEATTLCNADCTSNCWRYLAVGAGGTFSAVVRQDGTLWAFGNNDHGQLGLPVSVLDGSRPVQIAGVAGVVELAVGGGQLLARTGAGELWALGANADGQLGLGNLIPDRREARRHLEEAVWSRIWAGGNDSAGRRDDGTTWVWGQNDRGQLGIGTTGASEPAPHPLAGDWLSLSFGELHALGLKADGTVWSWGATSCQGGDPAECALLGRGAAATGSPAPEQVAGLSGCTAIAAGYRSSHAICSGELFSWGGNSQGQLGLGLDDTATHDLPQRVGKSPEGLSYTAVSAGELFVLALDTEGHLWSFGDRNNGAGGLGTNAEHLAGSQGEADPTRVAGGPFGEVRAAWRHSIALDLEGGAWTTGRNDHGQLGGGDVIWTGAFGPILSSCP